MAIPGLASLPATTQPDVVVSVRDRESLLDTEVGEWRIRYLSPERDADGSAQLTVWTGPRGAHRFRYHDGTEFLIDGEGTRVGVHWDEPFTEADAAVYLLGPVLGFIMRLRGIVSLHASAVMIGDRAVAFAGDAWAGKSTTAAAFASLGYSVLSDDLLPIVIAAGEALAYSSHPRLTMWPDSASALFGKAEALPSLTPTYDKRYVDLQNGDHFQSKPVPLELIYVLGSRTADSVGPCSETMRPHDALLSLVSHTYGNYLLDGAMRATEFDLLSLLVRDVQVRHIRFPADIGALRDSCDRLAHQVLSERVETPT
jgi:hypothetical protein